MYSELIMKSIEKCLIDKESRVQWHRIRSPLKGAIKITHREAMDIIRENDLVVVYESDREKIWGDREESFKKKWKNTKSCLYKVDLEVHEKIKDRSEWPSANAPRKPDDTFII